MQNKTQNYDMKQKEDYKPRRRNIFIAGDRLFTVALAHFLFYV